MKTPCPIHVNWFAVMICVIWICTTIVCIATRKDAGILVAAITTILAGIGYFIHKHD